MPNARALGSVMLGVFALAAAQATAATLFSDDFESATVNTTLNGRVADTGQTWVIPADWSSWLNGGSCYVRTNCWAVHQSKIAANGPAGITANSVPFTRITSGTATFEFDAVCTTQDHQLNMYLYDSVSDRLLVWTIWPSDWGYDYFFMTSSWITWTPAYWGTIPDTLSLHVKFVFDVGTKSGTVYWHDNQAPATSGSMTGTWSVTFQPDQIRPLRNAAHYYAPSGFDNIKVYTPSVAGTVIVIR